MFLRHCVFCWRAQVQIAVAFRNSSSFAQLLNATILGALLVTSAGTLRAQSIPTAQKTGEISAFALYTRLTPDYGPTNNNGLIFGADYTRFTRWWVNPAIEFRAKIATGSTVDEKSFGGGLRVEKRVHDKFHPYADFMVSGGFINYNFKPPPTLINGQPYTSDSTIVYSYGGGLDYDLTRTFAFRGDFQAERWYLDRNPAAAVHLTPTGWSLGVVYRVPFRPFSR
jgi:hypothetical protein